MKMLLAMTLTVAALSIAALTRGGDPASEGDSPLVAPPPPAPPVVVHFGAKREAVARLQRRLRREQRQLTAVRQTHVQFGGYWLTRAFLCIHHFEGSWTDHYAPYWGGLQMDRNFMRAYGAPFYRRWGTADHWPAFVQVAVAMSAYFTRGFEPWPNTSRACGLR